MQAVLSPSPASSSYSPSTVKEFPSSLHRRRPASAVLDLHVRGRKGLASSRWVFSFLPSSSRSSTVRRNFVTPAVLCKVPTITQDSFPEEVLKADAPVLVGFCADWCGPCKLIAPVIDSVAKDFSGSLKAVKIDVDANPELVKEYEVYGLPTLIVFKDGKEVPKSRKEGAINAKKLKALLDEVLPTIASL